MDGERTLRPIVVARVRPRWESELAALSPVLVRIDKEQNVVEICPGPYERSRAVHVTNALDESATQEDVWRLFESYLDDFLGRINLSIFAYGETGSGKTYTMSSLTLRFLTELLLQKGEYDDFAVSISMVEIDNERIYDLLSTEHVNLTIMNNKVKGAKW